MDKQNDLLLGSIHSDIRREIEREMRLNSSKNTSTCCLATTLFVTNILFYAGLGILSYIVVEPQYNTYQHAIQDTFLENQTQLHDMLEKFPKIIDTLCHQFHC
tara:strand:- start:333 stop:641 length:309 start_codon:yes stop_codon:yes gene_type:complete